MMKVKDLLFEFLSRIYIKKISEGLKLCLCLDPCLGFSVVCTELESAVALFASQGEREVSIVSKDAVRE